MFCLPLRTSSIFCTRCLSGMMVSRYICQQQIKPPNTFLRTMRYPSKQCLPAARRFHTSSVVLGEDGEESGEEYTEEDRDYDKYLREYHSIPDTGHSLMVIHPALRRFDTSNLTTPELELEEACTLVRTLPHWSVVEQKIIKVKNLSHRQMFSTTVYEELCTSISSNNKISAVFVNISRLNEVQTMEFQLRWKVPVFDRYSMVLFIFKEHAKSSVAKLQVALAEIPEIRKRLEEMHAGKQNAVQTGFAKSADGRGADTVKEIRKALLRARERKLRKAIEKIKSQREAVRANRKQREVPVISVVGYTNSGKTTLIKALTNDERMVPDNHLFATLDVTGHSGRLPNKMNVVYMDTVGFISNLHHNLFDAFNATLEDALSADVVVHVRDISHPDVENQGTNVMVTLRDKLTEEQMNNIIQVYNKVDKEPHYCTAVEDNAIQVSAVTGVGLDQLVHKVQEKLLQGTSLYLEKTFKVPDGSEQFNWLCQNCDVQDIQAVSDGGLLVHVVTTKTVYDKFIRTFHQSKVKQQEFPKVKRKSNKSS